jgi:hypothetical protein
MMKTLKKMLLLLAALVALRMAGRALGRQSQAVTLLWMLIAATAGLSVDTPKSRSTEARLNTLITQVFPNTGGTVNGSMTVTGNHVVNGTVKVSTTSGSATLEVGGGGHLSGSLQVDSGVNTSTVNVGASTSTATVAIAGNVHASSTGEFDGGITSGAAVTAGTQVLVGGATGGAAVEVTGDGHFSGTFQVDSTLAASNFSGSYTGGQGNPGQLDGTTATISQICSFANAIVNACHDAGLMV